MIAKHPGRTQEDDQHIQALLPKSMPSAPQIGTELGGVAMIHCESGHPEGEESPPAQMETGSSFFKAWLMTHTEARRHLHSSTP